MVWPDCRLVGAVERQAYAAAVLAAAQRRGELDEHPIWDDLSTFDCGPWRGRVDLVAAGFPCQPASVAGRRAGTSDERWLWPLVWKVTQDLGAGFLFVENVPGLLTVNGGRAFGEILDSLASRGWVAEWDCVPAGAVGAPHVRDRLFLLAADPNRLRLRLEPERDQRQGRSERAAERRHAEPVEPVEPVEIGRAGSDPRPSPTYACCDGSQGDGEIGPVADGASEVEGARHAPDADGAGRARKRRCRELDGGVGAEQRIDADGRGSARPRPQGVDAILAAAAEHWNWNRAPEPVVRRMDDGAGDWMEPNVTERLHALGNSVVPHAAAFALTVLWDRISSGD